MKTDKINTLALLNTHFAAIETGITSRLQAVGTAFLYLPGVPAGHFFNLLSLFSMSTTVNVPLDHALYTALKRQQQQRKADTGSKPSLATLILEHIGAARAPQTPQRQEKPPVPELPEAAPMEMHDLQYLRLWQQQLTERAGELRRKEKHLLRLHEEVYAEKAENRVRKMKSGQTADRNKILEKENREMRQQLQEQGRELEKLRVPRKKLEEQFALKEMALQQKLTTQGIEHQITTVKLEQEKDQERARAKRAEEDLSRLQAERERGQPLNGSGTGNGEALDKVLSELKGLSTGIEQLKASGKNWHTKDIIQAVSPLLVPLLEYVGSHFKEQMQAPSAPENGTPSVQRAKPAAQRPAAQTSKGTAPAQPPAGTRQDNGSAAPEQPASIFPGRRPAS